MSNETRTRILEAAWTLVLERGPGGATIGEIASAAGVSRQLVYFHFENRAGLLVAMARHHDVRSGFAEQAREAAGLEALIRAWLAYLPEILPVAQALEAAVITREDGADAWRDRMGALRETFRATIEREDALRAGWTADAAADWVWARVQPSTWRHLVVDRGWEPGDFVERTVASVRDELLANV